MTLNAETMYRMLLNVCDALISQEEELCKLDSFIGDGDHGITVRRGFGAVKEKLPAEPCLNAGALLVMAGGVLAETMGGAAGPLFGGFFSALGEAAPASGIISAQDMAPMFRAGLEQVKMIGGAERGDRTLVDALEPAVEAMEAIEESPEQERSLPEVLDCAVKAAKAGAEATRNMTAKKGRAKFLGEKSLGYQDAGATSLYLIIDAMASYCRTQ